MRWEADVVIAARLRRKDLYALVRAAQKQSKPGLQGKFPVDLQGTYGRTPPIFEYDRRGEVARIRTLGLELTPEVTYRSDHDRSHSHAGMGSDDTGSTRVHFEPVLKVSGTLLPETVMMALEGRHVTTLLDHPCLKDPRLLMANPHLNGAPAQNGQPAKWEGFGVQLPILLVPIGRRPRARAEM